MLSVTGFLIICVGMLTLPAITVMRPASAFSPDLDRLAQPPGRPVLVPPFTPGEFLS